MNSVINLLKSHTSVRSFTDEAVSEEDVKEIFEAARSASSSCFLQVTSIIRVTDKEKKKELAHLAGDQKQVENAPEFWVFCADYHRNALLYKPAELGWTEQLVVAVHDAGIMAQNAMAASESLGLGGCYIGGIRNNIEKVGQLLELPQNCFAVFGLAFGHPAKRNLPKPRLPMPVVFMENSYKEPDMKLIGKYDQMMKEYYKSRGSNEKDVTWSESLKNYLQKERRPFMLEYLKSKGWLLR